MGALFAPARLLVLLVFLSIFLVPTLLYILTLQKALRKCSPASRTMEPGMMWLLLVPLASFVFSFLAVNAISHSLRNEFDRRGILPADHTPARTLGLAMSVCFCCSVIPIFGVLAAIAALMLWALYWVKVASYSRALDFEPQAVAPGATI